MKNKPIIVPLPSPKGHAVCQPLTRFPVFAPGDGQDANFRSFVPDRLGCHVLEEVFDKVLDTVLQLHHLLSLHGHDEVGLIGMVKPQV